MRRASYCMLVKTERDVFGRGYHGCKTRHISLQSSSHFKFETAQGAQNHNSLLKAKLQGLEMYGNLFIFTVDKMVKMYKKSY